MKMEKVLLVGPSKKLESFSLESFENYRKEGYNIISYSDSIDRLKEIDFKPDYYSFIDPATIREPNDEDSFLNDVELLVADIFGEHPELSSYFNNFKRVFKYPVDEYPPVNAIESVPKSHGNSMTLSFGAPIEIEVTKDEDKHIDFYEKYYMFQPTFILSSHSMKRLNTDKFSCYLLPLVLFHFKNLKKIDCIGFGDFDVNRGWGSQGTDGYEDFKETFDIVAPYFKNFFEKNNIEINFLGDSNNNYYFKKLRE